MGGTQLIGEYPDDMGVARYDGGTQAWIGGTQVIGEYPDDRGVARYDGRYPGMDRGVPR